MLAPLFRLRHWLYRKGLLKSTKVDAFVVCVGNITLGGTGKTPLIMKLLNDLKIEKVALLSRGYGGWKGVGDEPALIKQKYPFVELYIGGDRVASARKAVADGHRLILMDDGMQHLRLKKDLVICTVDGEHPYRWLRDLPEKMHQADLVVIKGPKVAGVEGVQVKMVPKRNFEGKVAIFCGIGKPEQFRKSVLGQVVHELFLRDHEEVGVARLERFCQESVERGAKMLLCTEKDMVKLTGYPKMSLPIEALEMELQVVEGQEKWVELIKRIRHEAMG